MKCKTIKPIERKKWNRSGFSLIETLISLTLLGIVLISLALLILFALDAYRKTKIRFLIIQKTENVRNQILSEPFDSTDLEEGSYLFQEEIFSVKWEVKDISSTLKKISLSVSPRFYFVNFVNQKHPLTRDVYFYKSKYINKVKEELHD